jgi:hypothetical protein
MVFSISEDDLGTSRFYNMLARHLRAVIELMAVLRALVDAAAQCGTTINVL